MIRLAFAAGGPRWTIWLRALTERRRDADRPPAIARRVFSGSRVSAPRRAYFMLMVEGRGQNSWTR